MSKREDTAVIQDIKEAINRIISYTSQMEYEDFLQDYKTQDAVIRNIDIVWDIAKNEIPLLSTQLNKING